MIFRSLSWLVGKNFAKHPERHETRIRKWLMYFTLFAAAITVLVDLIILVYNFLGGDLTIRFFLKAAVILVVVAGVFAYYFWDIRRNVRSATNLPITLRWLTSGIMLAAVIGTFFVIGTPSTQRDLRFDERRVNDLSVLQAQIVDYWMRKQALPEDTALLAADIPGFVSPEDPESGTPYEYRRTGDLTFELCAAFSTESAKNPNAKFAHPVPPYGYGVTEGTWEHTEGPACFQRTIEPDAYEPVAPVDAKIPRVR